MILSLGESVRLQAMKAILERLYEAGFMRCFSMNDSVYYSPLRGLVVGLDMGTNLIQLWDEIIRGAE